MNDWLQVAKGIAEACYYAPPDFEDSELLKLSEEDQEKARNYIIEHTGSCDECGHTFDIYYLENTEYGQICSDCENNREENE
jgi:RNA polymerase-binding transcription factor DksA